MGSARPFRPWLAHVVGWRMWPAISTLIAAILFLCQLSLFNLAVLMHPDTSLPSLLSSPGLIRCDVGKPLACATSARQTANQDHSHFEATLEEVSLAMP